MMSSSLRRLLLASEVSSLSSSSSFFPCGRKKEVWLLLLLLLLRLSTSSKSRLYSVCFNKERALSSHHYRFSPMGFSFFCVNSFKDSSFFWGVGLRFVSIHLRTQERWEGNPLEKCVVVGEFFFFFLCVREEHTHKKTLFFFTNTHI